jgi:peptidoglycan/xylan/chitin deacetylase (PgdA/CDA1 family)
MQAVKDLIKNRYSSLMWNSGLLGAWLKVRPRRHRVLILNYHHITADTFADHLRSLVRAYRVITLDECCASLRGEGQAPPNSVVLTFDDAYRQFPDQVFPVLQRFDAPATMFVPTASIDQQEVLWFNKVKALVYGSQAGALRIGELTVPLTEDRPRTYHQVIGILNDRPIDERNELLRGLFNNATFSAPHLLKYQPLTWEQMREMRGLVRFGAHTLTHPNLATLDRAQQVDEIAVSKQRLEAELDCPVRHFAYPFGRPANIGGACVGVVREAGFSCAVTTNRGCCARGDDLFTLPRIVCDGIEDGRVLVTRLSDLWVCMST